MAFRRAGHKTDDKAANGSLETGSTAATSGARLFQIPLGRLRDCASTPGSHQRKPRLGCKRFFRPLTPFSDLPDSSIPRRGTALEYPRWSKPRVSTIPSSRRHLYVQVIGRRGPRYRTGLCRPMGNLAKDGLAQRCHRNAAGYGSSPPHQYPAPARHPRGYCEPLPPWSRRRSCSGFPGLFVTPFNRDYRLRPSSELPAWCCR